MGTAKTNKSPMSRRKLMKTQNKNGLLLLTLAFGICFIAGTHAMEISQDEVVGNLFDRKIPFEDAVNMVRKMTPNIQRLVDSGTGFNEAVGNVISQSYIAPAYYRIIKQAREDKTLDIPGQNDNPTYLNAGKRIRVTWIGEFKGRMRGELSTGGYVSLIKPKNQKIWAGRDYRSNAECAEHKSDDDGNSNASDGTFTDDGATGSDGEESSANQSTNGSNRRCPNSKVPHRTLTINKSRLCWRCVNTTQKMPVIGSRARPKNVCLPNSPNVPNSSKDSPKNSPNDSPYPRAAVV